MLNDFTRNWTNTPDGKNTQCKVFGRVVELVAKMKDGKYDSLGRDYIESKLSSEIAGSKMTLVDMNGKTKEKQITPSDCIIYALDRLEEHGLVRSQRYSKGVGIKVTKKGYERWSKKC